MQPVCDGTRMVRRPRCESVHRVDRQPSRALTQELLFQGPVTTNSMGKAEGQEPVSSWKVRTDWNQQAEETVQGGWAASEAWRRV